MLAIGIHWLTGRYAASRYNDRDKAEWPPEFARLYSALVSGWAEAGHDPAEEAALRWLSAQEAPAIHAPEAHERSALTHYVPVNDVIMVGSHNDQAKLHVLWQAQRLAQETLAGRGVDTSEAEAHLACQAKLSGDEKMLKRVLGLLAGGVETPKAREKLEKASERVGVALRKKLATQWGAAHKAPGAKDGLHTLTDQHRIRQGRTFPVVIPEGDRVFFEWPGLSWRACEHAEALERLVGRLSRLGHSSSMVTAWLTEEAPPANWVPDPAGAHVLRAVGPHQLDALCDAHAQHRGVFVRILPHRSVRYRAGTERLLEDGPRGPHTGGWFVFERVGGRPLPITAALDVATALRGAIFHHAADPIPEVLSGHAPDGGPSARPHAAFVALPFVGREHASGQLMGVAVAAPVGLSPEEMEPLLAAIGAWRLEGQGVARLRVGAHASWELAYAEGEPTRWAAREARWAGLPREGGRAARRWRSVTPIALGRNPGNLRSRDPAVAAAAWSRAEEIVRREVGHLGLPAPVEVRLSLSSAVPGSRPVGAFGPFPRKARGRARGGSHRQRVLVHAELRFDMPVRGPLLVGAGRHVGMGLMVPVVVEGA